MPPDAEDKEVFELFDKYNLHSLAVVDTPGCPIGAIEVDDVVTRIRRANWIASSDRNCCG